tara:strand:- start:2319 stop:3302 length:984 start_codon:yes stop_codon:yes gene_type:complete
MNTILVTGGAGFIGAYLVKKIIERGDNVVIVDTLRDVGAISYVHPKAKFINMDICDRDLYKRLKNYDFDVVYHLAAQSAGEPSYDDPKYDSLTNSYGTLMIAKFCIEQRIKKLIYTSTVAVYGNVQRGILTEDSPIDPDSIYGVSKYSGEMYIKQMLSNTDIDYTIFRVFNTYGPGENLAYNKKGMVSIYLSYIWKNKPIEIKGSLNRYRDFTYIDDTVDALILAEKNNNSYKAVYNLSSGIKTTVSELLSLILTSFNKDSNYPIIELEGTPGDSFGFHSDITKIKNDLKWDPKISLKQGLSIYSGWIESIKNHDDLARSHPFHLNS